MDHFKAMYLEETKGQLEFAAKMISLADLSKGDVVIKVAYTSLNYKDMLAVQPKGGVIRNYPMVPGIDLAGTVVSSESNDFVKGQEVLVTGYEMGMSHTGGFSQYARVPKDWVVPLPEGLSLKDVMIYGTAGLTAMLSILALENAGLSERKEARILVTGASGGVGSVALALLKERGYRNVTAMIRKDYQEAVVKDLGADQVIRPEAIFIKENPLLLKEQYDYVLDTVGGDVASHLIPQVAYNGAMSLCGNAAGIGLSTNVLPFILRGVNLLGIDSVQISQDKRLEAWTALADAKAILAKLKTNTISLEDIPETLQALKEGRHVGRTVVEVDYP
ncbi:TPA: YhdH/YhfP family quinone oxidoreductase [Streptococcus suis]|uniref:YhdH/YhfP family quinone oxidoreductase n=1 Tax=Streptococcus pluranimalium TaxID=82348 RepID=UPI00292D0051|nr:YhdH/YhfP family quinone oxidoreductase [Streptococcus pluranimalium]HEM6116559.1 YhdH/YhfP family quinone oxidoreductase [Streptococcus suis]